METSTISLIIMAAVIILFITDKLPSAAVALLGLTAMLVFKVCTVSEALSGFCSDIFILLLGMLIIGDALFESGAAAVIGNYAIKLSANRERRFIFISCIISAAMSAFLSNTAVIAMMMAICSAASAASESMKLKNLVIPVAVAAIYGGHCTLVGSTTQLTASGLLKEAAGLSFGMWDLMWVCAPCTVFIILYMTFIGYPIGKKIWGKNEADGSNIKAIDSKETKLSKKGITVLVIFALVILLFVTEVVSTGVAAMIGALLCILTKTIDQKKTFARLDWSCIIWLCSCLGLGKALNVSGGANVIASFLLKFFDGSGSPMVFFAAMVFVAMAMSQFMSNMACLLIIMPATLELVMKLGLSPYAFSYGMCLGAALTILTPLANGHIGMTISAGYKFSDYVKYGLLPTAVTYAMIVILTPLVFPLVG